MKIIGLTGCIGSGKTTVAKILKRLGAQIIEADAVSHQLIQPTHTGPLNAWKKVVKIFGTDILSADNRIDRKKLSEIVFSNPSCLRKLESILHPMIINNIKKQILYFKKQSASFIVIEAPLLIETGLDKIVDKIIVVKTPQDIRLRRVSKKLKITIKDVKEREKHQLTQKQKLKYADFVIDNSGSIKETRKQVEKMVTGYLSPLF